MSNVHVREKRHSSFSNVRSDVPTRNVAASARISLTDSSRVRQLPGRARPYRRSQLSTADSGSSSQIVKTSGSQVSTSLWVYGGLGRGRMPYGEASGPGYLVAGHRASP